MDVSQKPEGTEEIHLTDYWRVVKKRRTQALSVLFLVVTAALVMSFLATPA